MRVAICYCLRMKSGLAHSGTWMAAKSAAAPLNAVCLALLGALAALVSIPAVGGMFADCRDTRLGLIFGGNSFREIPPLLWPVLWGMCLALALYGFKGAFRKPRGLLPFLPTLAVLLFLLLQALGVCSLGTHYLECVGGG